jgi:biotin carboxylase
MKLLDAATINAYCRRRSIELVLPSDISTTLLLAHIHNEITPARTFPLANPENLALLHNKWRFMQWLGAHGLPLPESRLLAPDASLDDLDLHFPLIAKPLEECGGQGVKKINSLTALQDYMTDHRSHSADPFLIQTFVAGDDLVFGIFAEHGHVRAWTMQKFCDEGGGRLEYIVHPELLRFGEQIARELNYHGVAEFDVRLDAEGRPWFIECNPRLWASIVISMCMGVNYVNLGIMLAMGQPLPVAHPITGPYVWPERAMARILRRQMRMSDVSTQNRYGMVVEVSDPIPFASIVYDWLKSK